MIMKILHTIYTSFAKRTAIILTLLLTLGVTTAWAAEYSLTPNNVNTGLNNTKYITSLTEFTYNGITWKMNQWNPSNLQIKTNQGTNTNEFHFYNTTAFPGKITKVVITFEALTVSNENGFMFIGGTSVQTGTSNGTSGKWDANNKTITWTPAVSDNFTFFAFYQNEKVASGTNYLAESDAIVVTYESGYAVTYNNGGRGTAPLNTTASSVTLSAITATGYTNTGWKANVAVKNTSTGTTINANTLITNGTNVTLTQATTFTAQWQAKTYTITLNNQSADIAGTTSISATYNSNANLISNITIPQKNYHNFGGYYTQTNGNGTQLIDSEGSIIANAGSYTDANKLWKYDGNITLYAKWTEKPLTNYRTSCTTETIVTLDPNGGTISNTDGWTENGNGTYSKTHEGTEIALPTATKTNYIFGGWYNAETKYESIPSDLDESITLTAKWLEKQDAGIYWDPESVSVTIDADGNTLPVFNNPNEIEGITFSSSNSSVVVVDANGVITLGSTGTTATVTITATFDGNETYAAKTVTCSLTVHPSNCRWIEVTDNTTLEDGDEVVIVMTDALSNSYTLLNEFPEDKEVPDAIIISSTNSFIDDYIWIVGKDGEILTFESYKNRGNFLRCNNADKGIRIDNTANANRKFVVDDTYGYLKNTQTTKPRYLGVHNEDHTWYSYALTDKGNFPTKIVGQTLKFYKKTCLPANKFWIDYELANVTCTNTPPHSQIDQTGEDLLLEFSANGGYKLPETISVKMGETEIGNDENYCVWDKETGDLLIVGELITDNITITIEGCEQLAAPENLLATNITSTSAVLSWDAVAKADEYIVFVTDGETNLEIPTTNCTITIEGLSKNTYYLWDVTATADNYCDSKKPSVLTNEFTTLDVYTVTFNTDGGTDVAPQTVDHGGKVAKPANPTKTGYKFAGWYTEADTEFDFNTPITSATTLYAKWNANQYTITFLKQYGAGGTDKATVTFNSNNFSVVTIELPTRDGYEFGGYYTETGGAGLQIVDAEGKWLKNKTGYLDASGNWIKAESVNLYAKWTKIHTITWVVNNNTETPHYTSKVLDGNTIDELPNAPADDLFEDCEVNAFVGWSTDNIGLEPDATAPTDLFKTLSEAQSKIGAINGDKKFYAVYASEIEQIATFEADGLNGLSANSTLKWTHDNSGISLAISAGQRYTGSPKTFTITNGTSNYCEIVAPEGKSLKKAVVSITESKYKVNSVSSPWSLSTSSTTQTITTSTNATDLKMYATSLSQIRITQVDVTYTTYSNYITRCTALPDPVWGGATIDKTEIAVNCGETSSTNGAARISFPKETNFNLYKDITVEVTSGNFIIASSRDGEYSTSVTLSPTQNGENVGTFANKYVYVRAVAPPMSSNQLTGTITISGKQITTQVINVTATITCNEYTLTFNDCGDIKTITDFAGTSVEEMEPWAETCSEPFQYVFDGWATASVTNGTEEYEKVDFSTFTMPNNNTTIFYAVYRYAEEGGEPINGYVKVTEALSDWSGDYVIVDNEFNVAIQNTYEEDTKDNKTLKDVSVIIENDKIVSPTNDIIWTISKYGEYYTMYNTEAIKYAGITKNETRAAGLSEIIATGYSMNIIFDSNTKIAKVSSTDYNRCFSYSEAHPEWRTYSNNDANGKTGYLYRFSNKTIRYTSSLVCGTIEAADALVTSTKDQKVKVKVPITLESSTGATTINATSDNAAFDVTGLTDVEAGDHTIVVEYTPAEYNITETANITLSATNGATATFTVSGRSLPENFVIATKVGATWYALPANMNGATNPEGIVIDVDETTMTATSPNTTVYTLFPVKTTTGSEDRYAQYGDRVRFSAVNNDYKGLWTSSSESTIRNYAVIDDVKDGSSDASYEWKITTTIVDGHWQYTLQTDQSNNQKYLRYWTAASGGAKWGTYASGNDKLYFLPVTETKPFDYKVVEWYPTKVLIQTDAAITNPIVKIGGVLVDNVTCTNKGGKLYEISGLPLVNNPTKVLTLSYTADEVTYTNSKVVPIILSRETKSISGEPFVALTKEVYNYANLVVRDGATLTMDGTQEANTLWDVTIYPTSKISVPETKKLTVHSLTFFGGIDEIYNGSTYTLNKYGVPELSLKGSLKKSISTIDYLMRVNLDQMYSLAVPYDVQLADIKYWDGSDIALGSALYVSAYDGEARANQSKKTWIYETDFESRLGAATLKAGVGYTISAEPQVENDDYSILRMPMNSNIANDATEGEKKVSVTAHGIDANITDNHKGWNLVGNPYMTTIQGADDADLVLGYLKETGTGPWEWVEKTYRYVTIPSDDGTYYWQQKFTDAVLPPFKNFFVQVGTTGELVFDLGTRQSMPARSTQAAIEKEVEFEILMSNATRQDNTGLLISEEYSPAYEINADLEKMIGSMSVYTIYGGYKLAYNALSPINASEWIPMGYVAPAAGEYTLSLDDVENIAEQVEHVYIIDYNANNIVDLMDEEYKFTTDKEQNDNRFAINVVLVQDKDNTTTGLDMIQGNNAVPIKFIYQDKIYIQSIIGKTICTTFPNEMYNFS